MATRIYRKKYACPFRDGGCGGESCRLWSEGDCGLKHDAATAGDTFTAVADIGDQLKELVKLFREIVVMAEEEPTERTRPMQ